MVNIFNYKYYENSFNFLRSGMYFNISDTWLFIYLFIFNLVTGPSLLPVFLH